MVNEGNNSVHFSRTRATRVPHLFTRSRFPFIDRPDRPLSRMCSNFPQIEYLSDSLTAWSYTKEIDSICHGNPRRSFLNRI